MLTQKVTKDFLWDYHKNLSERMHQHGSIQSKYRLLGSAWLLFGLGVIGNLIKELKLLESPPASETFFLFTIIGIILLVGLLIIFVQDVLFYQNLIAACFIEQRALESAHPWLPQISNNARTLMKGKGRKWISRYYAFGIGAASYTIAGSIGLALFGDHETTSYIIIGVVSFILAFLVGLLFTYSVEGSIKKEMDKGTFQSRFESYKSLVIEG